MILKNIKNKNDSSKKNQRGITLIEILIVLAIIGALLATILPQIFNKLEASKVKQTKIIMSQIVGAINLYYTDCNKYPESLDELTKASDCATDAYLKKKLQDAWNRDFAYQVESGSFTLKSLGKDGRDGGDGINKDITSEDLN